MRRTFLSLLVVLFAYGCTYSKSAPSDSSGPSDPGDQKSSSPAEEASPPEVPKSGLLAAATPVVKKDIPNDDVTEVAEKLLIDPTGRLYTIGNHGEEGSPTIRITRFAPTGEVDASFGTAGDWMGNHGLSITRDTLAVAWKDGKILFGMTRNTRPAANPSDLFVFLHQLEGSLDAAFGTAGASSQDFDECANSVYDLEMKADGGFLALGDTCQIEPDGTKRQRRDVVAFPFSPSGVPQASFGKKGFIGPEDDRPVDLVVFPGDAFAVVADRSMGEGRTGIAVARFLADGTPDLAFDGDGVYVSDLGFASVNPSKAVADANGNLLIAGSYARGADQSGIFVLRLNANGRPDPTFGEAGVFVFDKDHIPQSVTGLVIGTNGKILVGGTLNEFKTAPWKEVYALRLNPNGTLDTNYGEAGIFHSNFGETIARLQDMQLAPDGSLVLMGISHSDLDKLILARLTK